MAASQEQTARSTSAPMTPLRRLTALARGSRRDRPETSRNGVFLIGSESFRKACAIHEDGTIFLVRAYHTPEIAAELVDLRARYDLPSETGRRAIPLAEMSALYGATVSAVVSSAPTGGQLRLQRVLAEAAALGASDIKLIERTEHGLLRIKVGAGEFTHGDQWQVEQIREAITWIYGHRDGGDGQATLVKGMPASFSIGQAGNLPGMPEGIAAFRGQIAWHGDLRHFLTLRLLPEASPDHRGDLAGLGLEEDALEALAEERRSEAGLVIIGGSTGDGKSTTLVRHLERLYAERDGQVSLYTIEDPVEYPAIGDGVLQFPVVPGKTPEERRANFSAMLMTFVRTNPDVGMVSEIRSADDVNEVLQFVTSGHKIYTTVHANSVGGILFRLIALGVRPAELAGPDVVNLMLRQKLVPVLCPVCADPLTGPGRAQVEDWLAGDDLLAARKDAAPILLRRNRAGCDECLKPFAHLPGSVADTARGAWAGYAGRRATVELIRLDDTYRGFVSAHDQIGANRYWLTPKEDGGMGGIPLARRLRALVAQGITDYEHIANEKLPDTPPAIAGPAEVAP